MGKNNVTNSTTNIDTSIKLLDYDPGDEPIVAEDICNSKEAARLLLSDCNRYRKDSADLRKENVELHRQLDSYITAPLVAASCAVASVILTTVIGWLVNVYTSSLLSSNPKDGLLYCIIAVTIVLCIINSIPYGTIMKAKNRK